MKGGLCISGRLNFGPKRPEISEALNSVSGPSNCCISGFIPGYTLITSDIFKVEFTGVNYLMYN